MNLQQLEHFYHLTYDTAYGFWGGWLGGTAIMAGGKIWTSIQHPHMKVSELLGYVGTPAFRRALAVGFAVYAFTQKLFQIILEATGVKTDRSSKFYLIPTALAAAVASVAASAVTHENYYYVQYPVCALTLAFLASELWARYHRTE